MGYIVINECRKNNENHLQIIDCVAAEKPMFTELIKFAIHKAVEQNDDLVKLWLTSKEYIPALNELGFEYGMHPFRLTLWTDDYQIPDMYLTMSDSDVF